MMFHESTFHYLKPTDEQMQTMAHMRAEFRILAEHLDAELPNGPDKTYIMRKLREIAMWTNVCITREADGTPRP